MKYLPAVLLLCSAPVFAITCERGCSPFNDVCACDVQPELPYVVQPSSEKPPKDKMPSYQREGVIIIDEVNLSTTDAHADQEKAEANEEGRRAARIGGKAR